MAGGPKHLDELLDFFGSEYVVLNLPDLLGEIPVAKGVLLSRGR